MVPGTFIWPPTDADPALLVGLLPRLRDQFTTIIETTQPCDGEAPDSADRSLVELFLDVSKHVINPAALGDQYEQDAWVVMKA
jgi:hypothetical protein